LVDRERETRAKSKWDAGGREERDAWGEAREENFGTHVTAVLFIPPIADCIGYRLST